MPQKSRERRELLSRRQGTARAIKSSDVGLAKGLSSHAAKKSSHVHGMRQLVGRSVGVKSTPGHGSGRITSPEGTFEHGMEPLLNPEERNTRVSGFDASRPTQRVLSHRSQAGIAMEKQRNEK
jgi:hypothetical protein